MGLRSSIAAATGRPHVIQCGWSHFSCCCTRLVDAWRHFLALCSRSALCPDVPHELSTGWSFNTLQVSISLVLSTHGLLIPLSSFMFLQQCWASPFSLIFQSSKKKKKKQFSRRRFMQSVWKKNAAAGFHLRIFGKATKKAETFPSMLFAKHLKM